MKKLVEENGLWFIDFGNNIVSVKYNSFTDIPHSMLAGITIVEHR